MTGEQQQIIRQRVIDWVTSPEFGEYYCRAHWLLRWTITGAIGELLRLRNPADYFTAPSRFGLQSDYRLRSYRGLAENGTITTGVLYKGNPQLMNGDTSYAPAFVVAGLNASNEGLRRIEKLCKSLAKMMDRGPRNPLEQKIAERLSDDLYRFGETYELPSKAVKGDRAFFFSVFMSDNAFASISPDGALRTVCVIRPDKTPTILPVPADLVNDLNLFGASETQPPASQGGDVVRVGQDDLLMRRAIVKARQTLPEFWELLNNPTRGEEGFSLKVAVEDGKHAEYFWVTDLTQIGDTLRGQIGNDPETVTNVQEGQYIDIDPATICDWMYIRDGKMYGNRTLFALLPHMHGLEAARMRQIMAQERDF